MSNIIITRDYEQMSLVAERKLLNIWEEINLLGLATGSTPTLLYELLAADVQRGNISFSKLYTVNLDEYVGLRLSHPECYRAFMSLHLFSLVDIPIQNTYVPFGVIDEPERLQAECEYMEKFIKDHGPVRSWILGIGENGHFGFAEPGTPADWKTFVVELTHSTRAANARFFENDINKVPQKAITAGPATIMAAEALLQLANSYKKEWAVTASMLGPVTIYVPSSLAQKHKDYTLVVDKEAGAGILRYIKERKIPEIEKGRYEVVSEAGITHQVTLEL